jgi:hypothetical protein
MASRDSGGTGAKPWCPVLKVERIPKASTRFLWNTLEVSMTDVIKLPILPAIDPRSLTKELLDEVRAHRSALGLTGIKALRLLDKSGRNKVTYHLSQVDKIMERIELVLYERVGNTER